MLTKQEARTIASIVVRPATDETNRISDVNPVLEKKRGYGDFAAMNLVEVLSVHRLLQHVTAAEWKSLKNGPGASRFLNECGISRADMLEYVISVFCKFEQDNDLSVILPGGRTKKAREAVLHNLRLIDAYKAVLHNLCFPKAHEAALHNLHFPNAHEAVLHNMRCSESHEAVLHNLRFPKAFEAVLHNVRFPSARETALHNLCFPNAHEEVLHNLNNHCSAQWL